MTVTHVLDGHVIQESSNPFPWNPTVVTTPRLPPSYGNSIGNRSTSHPPSYENSTANSSTPLLPPRENSTKKGKYQLVLAISTLIIIVLLLYSSSKTKTRLGEIMEGIEKIQHDVQTNKNTMVSIREDIKTLQETENNHEKSIDTELQSIKKGIEEIEIKMGITTTTTPATTKPVEKVQFGPYFNPYGEWKGKNWNAIGPFRKITVKTRIWHATRIVEGLILESINGGVDSIGMDDGNEDGTELVEELVVPEGQCIKEVKLRYGYYADQIGFVTDQKISLGPVGGMGGNPVEINPKSPGGLWCLFSIGGMTLETEGAPALAGLKFVFSRGG